MEDALAVDRESLRQRLASAVGAETADEIALVRNATEANNIVVGGLPLGPGDEVVLWDENHESNNVAWEVRAARAGFRVKRVTLGSRPLSIEHVTAAFDEVVTPRTRVMAITHVSNLSGFQLPVDALCRMARRRGIFVHVDGAQTWGVRPLNLRSMDCSSFSGSAHKWLMGPREVGLLYIRSRHIEQLSPSIVGLYWGTSARTVLVGARKFDCFGQRDDSVWAGMHAALDFHEVLGEADVLRHSENFAAAIRKECADLGLALASPAVPPFASSIVVIEASVEARAPIAALWYEKYGITVSRKGGIRLSPHIYNDPEDFERLAVALRETAAMFRA